MGQREDTDRAGARGGSRKRLVVGLAVGAALVVILARPNVGREPGSTGLRLELFPGSPGITLGERSRYVEDDRWQSWLADERTCPRGEDSFAPAAVQEQVLLCLVNFARAHGGLEPVALSHVLTLTAAAKARDIVICRDFRHEACGKPVFQVADDIGYRGPIGENLYVAEGSLTAPRLAVHTWLNSQSHRENLLEPEWRTIGISLLLGANLDNIEDGAVWVNHFGT